MSYILEEFLPALQAADVNEADIQALSISNPASWLAQHERQQKKRSTTL